MTEVTPTICTVKLELTLTERDVNGREVAKDVTQIPDPQVVEAAIRAAKSVHRAVQDKLWQAEIEIAKLIPQETKPKLDRGSPTARGAYASAKDTETKDPSGDPAGE